MLQPLGDRILLTPTKKENQTAGGIYIPDSAQEERKEGIVAAVGDTKLALSKGDKVLYGGYSNEEFEIEGKKYVIVEAKDVVAKFE